MRASTAIRYISVARMRELLDKLPPGALLSPNRVENLSVLIKTGEWYQMIAWIDFGDEDLNEIPEADRFLPFSLTESP